MACAASLRQQGSEPQRIISSFVVLHSSARTPNIYHFSVSSSICAKSFSPFLLVLFPPVGVQTFIIVTLFLCFFGVDGYQIACVSWCQLDAGHGGARLPTGGGHGGASRGSTLRRALN